MKDGLKIGLEHELVRVVTRDLSVLATRTPPVFATGQVGTGVSATTNDGTVSRV